MPAISGINTPATVSLGAGSNGSAQVLINGNVVNFSGPVTISNGDSIALRLTAASAGNASVSATLNVGTYSTTWSVTTKP